MHIRSQANYGSRFAYAHPILSRTILSLYPRPANMWTAQESHFGLDETKVDKALDGLKQTLQK